MKEAWDDCGVDVQAKILAFDQIMQHDEDERDAQLAGARKPFGATPSKPPVKPPPRRAASKGRG